MNGVGWDILFVLAIVATGGFFAAAEMALISLREGQIRALAGRGKRGQRTARLAHDPNKFLSAVQIGVTVATLLSGAIGAATLAGHLRAPLTHILPKAVAPAAAVVIVTLGISFFTLVIGELAPKRIALQRNERVSMIAAPLLDRIATLARPLVWLLSVSVNVVVRLLGGDPAVGRGAMTSEELRDLVAGHHTLSPDERNIVREVFDAAKRQLREVLVPRTEVEFLSASMPLGEAAATVASAPYSRYPVYQESYDDVIGFVHARDLIDPARDRVARISTIARPVMMFPISKTVMSALSEMRKNRAHLAIVVDEYDGTAGIVTLEDLVEELIGDITDEYDVETGEPRLLRPGEIEVDGLLNLAEFAEQTGIELPDGPYETVAGFLLASLGHLPATGESADISGSKLTVAQLDGRRIARVHVSQPAGGGPDDGPADAAAGGQAGSAAEPGTEDGGAEGGVLDDGSPDGAAQDASPGHAAQDGSLPQVAPDGSLPYAAQDDPLPYAAQDDSLPHAAQDGSQFRAAQDAPLPHAAQDASPPRAANGSGSEREHAAS